jgi:hypothetical protein
LLSHSSSDLHTTLSFQLQSTYYSLIPSSIHILLSHSSSGSYTTLSFQLRSTLLSHYSSDPHTTLSFHLRSTNYSLIPTPIHILLSHSSSDPHITLSFRLRSLYYSLPEKALFGADMETVSDFSRKLWGLIETLQPTNFVSNSYYSIKYGKIKVYIAYNVRK